MFCEKCGSALPDSARFCAKCGSPVQESDAGDKPAKKAADRGIPASVMLGKEKIGEILKDVDLQKTADDVKKTGNTVLNKVRQWVKDYLQTWQEWKKLQKKEQYIWFGIHGGVVLLLLCIVIVSSSGNIAKAINKVARDGEISDEDLTFLAHRVRKYKDVETIQKVVDKIYEDGRAEKYGFKQSGGNEAKLLFLPQYVTEECVKLSEFTSVLNYDEWYDKDGLAEVVYGLKNNSEYTSFSSSGSIGISSEEKYSEDQIISVAWYVYEDNNKITFVKTTIIRSDNGNEYVDDIYEGKYQVSDTEIVITLDGTDYHLTEADTDIAEAETRLFKHQAQGYWRCSDELYNMLLSAFDVKEEREYSDSKFIEIETTGGFRGVELVDEEARIIALINYEQGTGNKVTWSSGSNAIEVAYSKQGDTLTLTINGQDYSLEKANMTITDSDLHYQLR